MATGLVRWPPAGGAVPPAALWSALRVHDPERQLVAGLRDRLGGAPLTLHASGREALRVAFTHLAKRRGRDDVIVPAYACYSVPAAAVAAGLRVRLVDVTPEGRIDVAALAALPLDSAAALVVGNLFGVPEALGPLREALAGSGVAIVDDAAQALGARDGDGPVGARGDLGLLSFGRAKPLSALGGGALVWSGEDRPEAADSRPRRGAAVVRALAYDVARHPVVFRWLASIPALGIGETHFDPAFARGPIDGAALCLAAAALQHLEEDRQARAGRAAALARDVAGASAFAPVLAGPGATGAYPRLAVVAPGGEARNAALDSLRELGATGMYPDSLDRVSALAPHLAAPAACSGARAFAHRVLTLPTFRELRGRQRSRVLETLAALS